MLITWKPYTSRHSPCPWSYLQHQTSVNGSAPHARRPPSPRLQPAVEGSSQCRPRLAATPLPCVAAGHQTTAVHPPTPSAVPEYNPRRDALCPGVHQDRRPGPASASPSHPAPRCASHGYGCGLSAAPPPGTPDPAPSAGRTHGRPRPAGPFERQGLARQRMTNHSDVGQLHSTELCFPGSF